MKRFIFLIVLGLAFSFGKNAKNDNLKTTMEIASTELEWLTNWFKAWELVSTDILKLPESQPPILLFYDKEFVYTTSEISAPNGTRFNGPKYFAKKLTWLKEAHNDTLTIPNGQRIPIQLMTFAAPFENSDAGSFFVMAAPSFWKGIGLENEDIGLDKMLTGIFLHEFTHTRQMKGVGQQIIDFDKNHTFDFKINDDIIQNYFSDDLLYTELFTKETDLFYKASEANNRKELVMFTDQGLNLLKHRQENYLKPKKEILVEMDNVFLSMEGIGQYVMVAWLSHPEGGKVSGQIAIKSTRRNKKWWSQDEGLGLVLVYTRLVEIPDWNLMFDQKPETIVFMIQKELK